MGLNVNIMVAVIVSATFMQELSQSYAWIFHKHEGRISYTRMYATRKPDVHVQTVKPHSSQDILDLADMRYREWIQGDEAGGITPSLGAFRMATAEIVQERTQEGAMQFIARMDSNAENEREKRKTVVVGSAELSPIEFKGAVKKSRTETNETFLYVNDVVTSTTHRRLGVGTKLMDAMEQAATGQFNATRIYLHVRSENIGALEFYFKRGFQKTQIGCKEIDVNKLEEVTGAIGQILLQKEVSTDNNRKRDMHNRTSASKHRNQGATNGFAKTTTTRRTRKAQR